MKSKCITLALGLLFSAVAGAEQELVCPGLEELRQAGFSEIIPSPSQKHLYWGCQASNYGTDKQWFFLTEPVTAYSAEDAREGSLEVLNSLAEFAPLAKMCIYSSPIGQQPGNGFKMGFALIAFDEAEPEYTLHSCAEAVEVVEALGSSFPRCIR